MRYLFVMLMWNGDAPEPVPADIYAVCCCLQGQQKMIQYARYVKTVSSSPITEKTKNALYQNLVVLEQAKPLAEVLNKLAETFPQYDGLVMWSRRGYELFRRAMHDNGHRLCGKQPVLLEEVMNQTICTGNGSGITFRKAIRLLNIEAPQRNYYQPRYRAGYLFEMWQRMNQLAMQCESWQQTEMWLNPNTGCVHLQGCRHINGDARACTPQVLLECATLCKDCRKRNALKFWDAKQVRQIANATRPAIQAVPQEYPPSPKYFYRTDDPQKLYHSRCCACCKLRKSEQERLLWQPLFSREEAADQACDACTPIGLRLDASRAEITEFCRQRGMEYTLKNGVLDIVTQYSAWKLICAENGKLSLYHKNTCKSFNEEAEEIPGYHSQAIHKKTIMEYLCFIVQHDGYRKNNPLNVQREKNGPPPTHKGRNFHTGQSVPVKHHHRKKKVEKAATWEELQALAEKKKMYTTGQ